MAASKNKKGQLPVEKLLEVTDTSGKPLLIMPQEQVFRHRLRYKGVIVCLRNLRGRIFLYNHPPQTSAPQLFSPYGGFWGHAASSCVFAGEAFHDAALRCLDENLGITDIELAEVARLAPSPLTGNAEAALFLTAKTSLLPRVPGFGHQTGMFVDQEELHALLHDFPYMVAPFLTLTLPYIFPDQYHSPG